MNTIPKIIHQIWIGPNPEPTIWTDTFRVDYLSSHPHYEYRLWNDQTSNEILTKYPMIKVLYDLEQTWNGKSDILRYVILYEHGGIYIDADSVWVNKRSFDILLEDCTCGLFAAREPGTDHITGGVIGASVGHTVFKKIMDHLESYIITDGRIKQKKYIRLRAGKGPSTLLGPTLFNQYAQHEIIKLFPSQYFYPVTWHGIKTIDAHKQMDLPSDCFMFQYGYSTNHLSDQII
jgi:mannosyltransferase OCH1-like enzyme